MVGRGRIWIVSFAILLSLNATASTQGVDAGSPLPLSERPEDTLLPDAPVAWREYFIHARRAERVPDALQRCLAYPDLPGNKWPQGYSAMHCHYHHGATLSPAEIADHLARGDVATLEAQIEATLARHAQPGPERESGHRIVHRLTARDQDIDRITARWVELAPESAFAALARATFFRASGWRARGTKFAGKTFQAQMDAMSEWFDKAEAEYRRALKLRPDLLEAYIGLMDIGRGDRDSVGAWAFAQARAIDPGCAEVAYTRMTALLPRWGGSYPRMQAYWAELEPHLDTTPLLVNQRSTIYADYVSVMEEELQYQAEAAGILEIAIGWSGDEDALHDAADNALNFDGGPPDPDRGVALLLQASRFKNLNAWGNRVVAGHFLRSDAEWALRFAREAVIAAPDHARARYLLAAANYNTGRFEEAERHYLLAADDDAYAQASLRELCAMWLFDAGLPREAAAAKARPFIDRLLEHYPEDGRGWLLHMYAEDFAGRLVQDGMVHRFLEVADLDDPIQANERAKILEGMKRGTDADKVPGDS